MAIYSNSELEPDVLPGLSHRTLAGPAEGLKGLEVWSQRIEAGGATPPHRHDCEEVVIILEGEGTLHSNSGVQHFRGGDTIVVPQNEQHQILNTGSGALRLIAALNMAPVRVKLPDGTPLDLPWHRGI